MHFFSTTDVDSLPRNEAGLIGGQKGAYGSGIGSDANALQWNSRGHLLEVVLFGHTLERRKVCILGATQARRDMVWTHSIYRDTCRTEVDGGGSSESDDAVLGGAVRRHMREA